MYNVLIFDISNILMLIVFLFSIFRAHPVNTAVQYDARLLLPTEANAILVGEELRKCIENIAPRLKCYSVC